MVYLLYKGKLSENANTSPLLIHPQDWWKGTRERARQVFNFHIRTSVDNFTLSQTWLTLAIGPYQFNFGAKPEQQNHQTHSYAVLVPKLNSILVMHKTF